MPSSSPHASTDSTPRLPALVPEADARFRQIARELGLDPDNLWVGGYVEYEWTHSRHVFETLGEPLGERRVLEFGCNVGATSVTLAALGAHVTAIDVDERALRLARANVERYGVARDVTIHHLPDTTRLPFPDACFDMVSCNSVLEYVPHDVLPAVQREIDRVLKPGGLILVMGTSSRLWPREVHSGRWLVNWMPRALDRLFGVDEFQRGVFPAQMRKGFGPGYENLDRADAGRSWVEARARMGSSGPRLAALRLASAVAAAAGTSLGLLVPNISVRLRKSSGRNG